MGACLTLLRQAGATLETEANGVTDNPLIFADTDEALSGGNFHAEPVAFAADTLALALCEIGSIAERRIAMLVDPALSGLPAFLTPRPGLNRSEEHTSELQSLMRISYAVFCLKKKKQNNNNDEEIIENYKSRINNNNTSTNLDV